MRVLPGVAVASVGWCFFATASSVNGAETKAFGPDLKLHQETGDVTVS